MRYLLLLRIYIETIKATHAGLVSEQFLQTVSEESTRQRLEGIFHHQEHHPFGYVCTDHGSMIGFAIGDVATYPPEGYQGELRMIYVLPAYHRRGVGRKLLRAVAEHFEREQVASMFLGVFTNNSPARRFYFCLAARILKHPKPAPNGGFIQGQWLNTEKRSIGICRQGWYSYLFGVLLS